MARHAVELDSPDDAVSDRGRGVFLQEIHGFFAGLTRTLGDEAATLKKSEHLRRVA